MDLKKIPKRIKEDVGLKQDVVGNFYINKDGEIAEAVFLPNKISKMVRYKVCLIYMPELSINSDGWMKWFLNKNQIKRAGWSLLS